MTALFCVGRITNGGRREFSAIPSVSLVSASMILYFCVFLSHKHLLIIEAELLPASAA